MSWKCCLKCFVFVNVNASVLFFYKMKKYSSYDRNYSGKALLFEVKIPTNICLFILVVLAKSANFKNTKIKEIFRMFLFYF